MAKRNYTREILAQIKAGRVPVSSVGPEYVVQYAPRSKSDPQPWVSGAYRYNGREVHTMEPCGRPLLSMRSGGMTSCAMHGDHNLACRSGISYIRYNLA